MGCDWRWVLGRHGLVGGWWCVAWEMGSEVGGVAVMVMMGGSVGGGGVGDHNGCDEAGMWVVVLTYMWDVRARGWWWWW